MTGNQKLILALQNIKLKNVVWGACMMRMEFFHFYEAWHFERYVSLTQNLMDLHTQMYGAKI